MSPFCSYADYYRYATVMGAMRAYYESLSG